MGNSIFRNRHWYYRSLYDDYMMREMRMAFGVSSFLYLPFYWWGVHINREFEVNMSHKNYIHEWGPRRNRLTHSMLFEEFEMVVEKWQELNREYAEDPDKMLAEAQGDDE